MSLRGTLSFVGGAIVGVACGVAAGILMAPRPGSESRAMASDVVNDAWDNAMDAYEQGSRVVSDKVAAMRPHVDATSDELRAKVDLARERMDQLRESLSETVATTSAQVQDAVSTVTEKVSEVAADIDDAAAAEAKGVRVEVVEDIDIDPAGQDVEDAAE
jgi:gas vesicle protein